MPAQLGEGPGGLREDQHAVPLVEDRPFLRHQVHPVHHRVDQQDVVQLVGGQSPRVVVLHRQPDRGPAGPPEPAIDPLRGAHALVGVGAVLAKPLS